MFDRSLLPRWAIALGVLALAAPAAGADDDLLAVARERHRAARLAIRTLSADVRIEITAPQPKVWRTAKYWRSLDTVLVRDFYPDSGEVGDALLKDGVIRGVGRHPLPDGRSERHGAELSSAAGVLSFSDAYWNLLLRFADPPMTTMYDYERFLERAARPPKAARDTVDGVACVRVSMTIAHGGAGWEYTFWHDIDRNYLIRKLDRSINGEAINSYEIQEFREAAPGVFVPIRCRLRIGDRDKPSEEHMTTLGNVRVNEPLGAEVFVLPPIPSGTVLHDRIDGTRYPIDAGWKAIGPKVDNPIIMVPNRHDGPGGGYTAPTAGEPRRGGWWVAPAGAAALAAAVAAWAYRRRRARHQPSAAP